MRNNKDLLKELTLLTESFDFDNHDEEDEVPSVKDAIQDDNDQDFTGHDGDDDEDDHDGEGDDYEDDDLYSDDDEDVDEHAIELLRDAFATTSDKVKAPLISMLKLIADNKIDFETLARFVEEEDVEGDDSVDFGDDDEDDYQDDHDEEPDHDEDDEEEPDHDEDEFDRHHEDYDDEWESNLLEDSEDAPEEPEDNTEEPEDDEDQENNEGYGYNTSGIMDLGEDFFGDLANSGDI